MSNVKPYSGTVTSRFVLDQSGNRQMYATFSRPVQEDGSLGAWEFAGFATSTEQLGKIQMSVKTSAGQEDDVFWSCMMPMENPAKGSILTGETKNVSS